MKTFREYINLIESAQHGEPLAEGVMDRLRRIYMGLVYDTPMGTPDSEFLSQWQRMIKDQLGQDIDWDTLANLQQHWREQGRRMTRRGDLGKWYREMGITEQGVAEAGNKPVEKSYIGTGDTRTPRELKTQMRGASDEFVRSTADTKTGPFHSKVAKMQGKLAKSELRRREQGVAESIEDTRRQANLKKKIDAGRATDAEKKEYQALKAKNTGKKQGVAEGLATQWEVSFDYGPHMSKTVKVKAGSKQEARTKVEKAAEKSYTRGIMINWVKPAKQGVAEGSNDTVYPNAEVIKSRNGRPVGEIYRDNTGTWGYFHYRADFGADGLDSREDAMEELKLLHAETGRGHPDYTIKGVAEGYQDLEETQQMEEDPVAQITRLHRELNRR